MLSRKEIWSKLRSILDPELGINIVDLGLVYDLRVREGRVEVVMTLTTMGCPLFPTISENIKKELKRLKGVEEVGVRLTFEPAWTPERMSKEARKRLGFND